MKKFNNHQEGEEAVLEIFRNEQATQTEINEVLEGFLATRINRCYEHGYWVHGLSHFTEILWNRGMYDWVKRFYLIAFTGANELGDSDCCDRLVGNFMDNAGWNTNPADFHITSATTTWLDPKYYSFDIAYIAVAPFESEAAFLIWKLGRPETYKSFNSNAQMDMVPVDKIKAMLDRLHELGANTSEFENSLQQRLDKQSGELELELTKTNLPGWKIERLQKAIDITHSALDQL